MATQPIRYVFNVCKEFKQVRHYQSVKELNRNDLLTSTINIGKNRLFNNSKDALYFLKTKEGKTWSKRAISGLLKTGNPLIYYGDIPTIVNKVFKKTHLLIFVFNRGGAELSIYLYKNYYPKNTIELNSLLSNYY